KCRDEFLSLNIPWNLTTDSYLTLVKALDLQDELFCILQTVSRIERMRLLRLLLDSPLLSSELLMVLFVWTTDVIITDSCKTVVNNESTERPVPIVDLNSSYKGGGKMDRSTRTEQGFKRALEIIQRLVKDIVRALLEHSGDQSEFINSYRSELEQWNELIPGFSDVLPMQQEEFRAVKRRHVESESLVEKNSAATPLDDHQRAFITICNTIQRHQDVPECPPSAILRLASNGSFYNTNLDKVLEAHITWVESTIRDRSAGWQSCVKLKLQFYAIFDESAEDVTFEVQQRHNFVDFVLKATVTNSHTGQVVLDTKELLVECIAKYLEHILNKGDQSNMTFQAVSDILMQLYGSGEFAPSVASGWVNHQVHYRILLQLLRLRTMKEGWVADLIQNGHPSHQTSRYDHIEDISRVCEQLVARMSAYIRESIPTDQRLAHGQLNSFLQTLGQHDDRAMIDSESSLIVVPLLNACRQHLGGDVMLPALPPGIWLLCQDHLEVFAYQDQHHTIKKQTRGAMEPVMDASRALSLVLDMGRMCDDVLADIVQAMQQVAEAADFQNEQGQHHLKQLLFPALYRILSISSRSEGLRLLTQGVPTMVKLWGGPPEASSLWNIPEEDHTSHCLQGPYWSSYARGKPKEHIGDVETRQHSENSLSVEETLLAILGVSEILLRYSLEPLPSKNMGPALEVYRIKMGYDMTADNIAPLLVSSIKALPVNWATAPLDLVLYCFTIVCKLSYLVVNQHTDKVYRNRLGPHSDIMNGISEKDWVNSYTRLMTLNNEGVEQQEQVARVKAKEELVLAAMHFSEEIVRRHDQHDQHYSSNKKEGMDASEANISQRRKRHYYRFKRRAWGRYFKGKEGRDQLDINQDLEGPQLNGAHPMLTSKETDQGTQACLNSIGSSVQGKALANNSDGTLGEAMDTEDIKMTDADIPNASEGSVWSSEPGVVSQCPGQQERHDQQALTSSAATVGLELLSAPAEQVESLEITPPMLSQDQIDCLMLALSYLPAQEQEALKRRLSQPITLDSLQVTTGTSE
ncbi:hypothetical protein BGZ65_008282, partial [Modicella reniformis]